MRAQVQVNERDGQQQIANLQSSMEDSQREAKQEVTTLANRLAVDRVTFEATKNRTVELSPGVTLRVTKIDVPMHRVSGWMWVLPDRRTVWLRDQPVQQPVTFYGREDGKKRELVITSVTPGAVAGYYLNGRS